MGRKKKKKITVIEFVYRGNGHKTTALAFKHLTVARLWREFNSELLESELEDEPSTESIRVQACAYVRTSGVRGKMKTRIVYGISPYDLKAFVKSHIKDIPKDEI